MNDLTALLLNIVSFPKNNNVNKRYNSKVFFFYNGGISPQVFS